MKKYLPCFLKQEITLTEQHIRWPPTSVDLCTSNELKLFPIRMLLDNRQRFKNVIFAAYNTKGVVNPAFGGSREVLIDMPPRHEGDVKIDMDGSPSVRPPSHKGDVKIDMGGHPVINPPSSKGDVKLDMDWDPSLDTNLTDGNPPDLTIPEGKPPGVDLPESKLSASGLSGGSLPGADADVIIQRPAKPTFNVDGPKNMVSKCYNPVYSFVSSSSWLSKLSSDYITL